MADCVPERAGALAQKTGNRLHVRNFLRGYPPDVLEDSDLWTPRRRLREVLWIKRLDERGEVGGEIPHLDFCLRRPVAAKQVEEQCNAHIVGALERRGVDNNGAVWITRQCIERILPDRCRSVSGDSALQHDLHVVIRTQPAQWAPPLPVAPGVILSVSLRLRCQRLFGRENPSLMSVLRCIQGFRREPLDGGDECAVEVQPPSKVIGGLFIERIRTGPGALKSIQGIFKCWNR